MKRCGIVYRRSDAKTNCTHMWMVVTKRGDGNPKCSGENIHLLYTEIMVAKKNLGNDDQFFAAEDAGQALSLP